MTAVSANNEAFSFLWVYYALQSQFKKKYISPNENGKSKAIKGKLVAGQ